MSTLHYFRPYVLDDICYSVDMVRITFKFDSESAMLGWVHDNFDADDCRFYQRERSYSYKYFLTFATLLSSYTVACGFIANGKLEPKGWIEFNPNKILGSVQFDDGFVICSDSPFSHSSAYDYTGLFYKRFSSLRFSCRLWELKRFDMAVDVSCLFV